MAEKWVHLTIDLEALAHNLSEVRRLVGPDVRIMAVVKADAYGHGLLETSRRLVQAGADALGVMNLHEALLLKDAGLEPPVFILAGFEPEDFSKIIDRDIIPFIYERAQARALNRLALKAGRKARVNLKIDTGMSRLGFPSDEAEEFLQEATGMAGLEITGLCSHFAEADEEDELFTRVQLGRLVNLIVRGRSMGLPLTQNSAANSAAVLGSPQTHLDLVRPGLMLYGAYPAQHAETRADLHPVMNAASTVIQIRKVRQGEAVSYGRTWKAGRETALAVVPVGYAHGYDRLLSNKGYALIRGRRAPIRGRVCMNLTMFDVTHIPQASVGDQVILLGRQGDEIITGDQLAQITRTISYEIFCNLGGVNPRKFI